MWSQFALGPRGEDLPRAARYRVTSALAGFALASILVGLVWWALAPAPSLDHAREVTGELVGAESVAAAEHIRGDAARAGAQLVEVTVADVDPAAVRTTARSLGWDTLTRDGDLVVDTGDDFLRIASASRVVVDTHRTPWPALAVVGAGIAGGLAAGAVSRRRSNTRRTTFLAVATLPAAGTVAVAVLVGFLLTPIGRPDPAAAAMGGVLLTWWLAVPAGVVLALLARRSQAAGAN